MRTYSVILEPAEEGGFVVTVPALPEVGTQGDTREEAIANAREAIEVAVEARIELGEPLPPDCEPVVEKVTVAA
ncbi:MAG: type II toxin-antitoxin system HicB family antitoxin [Hyphomicrobiaceae bacterium]|nr:type II toxin-antitoxin system HicB family antitoxin [Hyphomicrobiaceae bacterium]